MTTPCTPCDISHSVQNIAHLPARSSLRPGGRHSRSLPSWHGPIRVRRRPIRCCRCVGVSGRSTRHRHSHRCAVAACPGAAPRPESAVRCPADRRRAGSAVRLRGREHRPDSGARRTDHVRSSGPVQGLPEASDDPNAQRANPHTAARTAVPSELGTNLRRLRRKGPVRTADVLRGDRPIPRHERRSLAPEKYILDFSVYEGQNRGIKGLPELVRATQELVTEHKKWTLGASGGLAVHTRDAERDQRRQNRSWHFRRSAQAGRDEGWRAAARHWIELWRRRYGYWSG